MTKPVEIMDAASREAAEAVSWYLNLDRAPRRDLPRGIQMRSGLLVSGRHRFRHTCTERSVIFSPSTRANW